MAVVFRRAEGGFEKGALFRVAGPAGPGERHLQGDPDEMLLLGGLLAFGVGVYVYFRSQSQPHCPSGYVFQNGQCVVKPPPPPAPTPTPSPAPSRFPVIRVGSTWLSRPDWVAQHGNQAPFYGLSGEVLRYVAAGTVFQTIGPLVGGPEYWIPPSGAPVCCAANGALFSHYPVAGGFFNPNDVTVVG